MINKKFELTKQKIIAIILCLTVVVSFFGYHIFQQYQEQERIRIAEEKAEAKRKKAYEDTKELRKEIDAYIDALKPGGTLVLKSRSYTPSLFTANAVAMKEVCIKGARYGDFSVASHILTAAVNHLPNTLDTKTLFGNIYKLSQFEEAFAEAERTDSKKTFFKICAE